MHTGVTFWTEGGPSIGMGHLIRSLNIAAEVKASGRSVHFLVNRERAVAERIRQAGLQHITYPLTSCNASRLAGGVVVIDTKRDVTSQIRELKENGKKVLLMDNTVSSGADCVVIPSAVYRGPSHPDLLAGKDYVIIGRNLITERLKGETPDSDGALNVLVTMGGADPNAITLKVAEALRGLNGIKATIVIGPAFRYAAEVMALRQSAPENFSFVMNASDLAPLMSKAHMAITAVGTTIYELAYMGVPSALIANYREDSVDLAAFEALGVSKSLGFHGDADAQDIRKAVKDLIENRALLDSMSKRAASLLDGKGAARIASIIESFSLSGGEHEDHGTEGIFHGARNA